MKKFFIALFYVVIGFPCTANAQKPLLDLMKNHKEIRKAGKVEMKDDIIHIISTNTTSGMRFVDNYDFTGYNTLRITVENIHPTRPLQLLVEIMNSDITHREPVRGLLNRTFTIMGGETRTVDFELLPPLPHPEVAADFRLMRNNPYSRLTKTYCYDVDLAKVEFVKIAAKRVRPGQEWRILSAQMIPGELKELPKEFQYTAAQFFPFIDKYGQFKYAEWPGKTHSDKDLKKARIEEQKDLAAHPGPDDRSKFGGYAKGPRHKATGHFRVEKINGKWWMIDPEGYLFWSNGVVRVTPSSAITPLEGKNLKNRCHYYEDLPKEGTKLAQFYRTHDALLKPYYTARDIDSTYDFSSANCYRKYGNNYKHIYGNLAHQRLRSWGLNTIANSSDKDICLMDKTAYTDRFEVVSKPLEGTTGWWPFMDPYDPSFMESIEKQFVVRRKEVEDPWCLGLFVDNEIKWGSTTYLAEMTLKAPADQQCKMAMIQWLQKEYSDIDALNKSWKTSFSSWEELLNNRDAITPNKQNHTDLQNFNRQIIRKYFSNIKDAFQKFAPGMLYMGCRFAGSANDDVTNIAAEYCDVMSCNSYQFDLEDFNMLHLDKPIMIGEYHFGAQDRGIFHASLINVENQKQRGEAIERYIQTSLENHNIIGVHWHQFSDQATTGRFDGEDFQVGFTDCCDRPYQETINSLRNISYKMYDIRMNSK